jgi:hypothetical protein
MEDFAIRINNIITIKGVFMDDLENPETVYEKRPMSSQQFIECIRGNNFTTYSTIPKRFTTVAEWPKMTNLWCWSCSRAFTSYPKFVPRKREVVFIDGKETTHWIPHGNFCRWNCVIDYIRTVMPPNTRWDLEHNTCVVASIFEGKKILCILPSPPKTEMKQYCGDGGLTELQYDEKIQLLDSDYELSSYKLNHLREY